MAFKSIIIWLSARDSKWLLNEPPLLSRIQMSVYSLVERLDVKKRDISLFDHYSISGMSNAPLTITPVQITFLTTFFITDTHQVCPIQLVLLKLLSLSTNKN